MGGALDERLEWAVRSLDGTGWGAEVCDADRRLIWVSPQTRALIGQPDALIERLDPDDANEIGIDPETVSYSTVAELPDGPEKAIRDAGSISVREVPCERS